MRSRKNICRVLISCLALFIFHFAPTLAKASLSFWSQRLSLGLLPCRLLSWTRLIAVLFLASFFICSCDHGQIGGADVTGTYYPGDEIFNERLGFLSGLWYSRSGSRLLDSYHIDKWSDLTTEDKEKAQYLFPSIDIDKLKTYATEDTPQDGDYVCLYDDTVFEPGEGDPENVGKGGFCYMGIVRAINIFNNDIRRGAIIIEYFEGADPAWLSDPDGYAYQGLEPGEKPFYGIYFKTLNQNTVQMANPVDLVALNEGKPYYAEKGTLQEAINFFNVENEAEFISWGVVSPHNRSNEN